MVIPNKDACWRLTRNQNLKYPIEFTVKTGFPQYIVSWLNCLLTMPWLGGKGSGLFVAAHPGQRNHYKASWMPRSIAITSFSGRWLVSNNTDFHVPYLTYFLQTTLSSPWQCWDFKGVPVRFTASNCKHNLIVWGTESLDCLFKVYIEICLVIFALPFND